MGAGNAARRADKPHDLRFAHDIADRHVDARQVRE
jgi:hypothetical protein